MIAREIMNAMSLGPDGCYTNLNGCYSPFECEFLKACEAGAVSESIYRYKEKAHGKS
jgi:hypothetical protein